VRILVLYWDYNPEQYRLAVRQHVRALQIGSSRHQLTYWNAYYKVPSWLKSFRAMDAVLLHNTLLCMRMNPRDSFEHYKRELAWLSDVGCVKVAVPQDEYNCSWLLDEWLGELGVSVVISNFDGAQRKILYPTMIGRAVFLQGLTGYIDEDAARNCAPKLRPISDRPVDIVYRATSLPFWLGSHGQMKHRIAHSVAERAAAHGLRCDISTRVEDTIFGVRWLDFLASGKAVIGCESGSSVLDHRGETRARVLELCRLHPTRSFEDVSRDMPSGWDGYRFFALSPRHLEAVVTKTCQVLVEGEYSGVLEAHKHYIPLKPDFSNLDDVLEQIRDADLMQDMAERAYADIYLRGRWTYRHYVELIESAVAQYALHHRSCEHRFDAIPRMAWMRGRVLGRLGETAQWVGRRVEPTARLARAYWRMYWSVAWNPLIYAKAYVALKLVAVDNILRDVVIQWLLRSDVRKAVMVDRLMEDLLKLSLLLAFKSGHCRNAPRVEVGVSYDDEQGVLLFRSKRDQQATAVGGGGGPGVSRELRAGVASLKTILWDHSAIGSSIQYPLFRSRELTISLDPGGVHEFKALAVMAQRCPVQTWNALARLVEA
jgi:hypothetical protein